MVTETLSSNSDSSASSSEEMRKAESEKAKADEKVEVERELEVTGAEAEELLEKVEVTKKTKVETRKGLAGFFDRLKMASDEMKKWKGDLKTILAAIWILFWAKKVAETQEKQGTEKTWGTSNSSVDVWTGWWTDNSSWNTETSTKWSDTSGMDTWTSNQSNKEKQEKEPWNSEIVSLKEYIKDIKFDLKYATADNSFWLKIYPDGESNLKLQYEAIKKLADVQESLKKQWYQLKIWDAYRPTEAQQKLYDNYKWPASTKSSNVAKPWTSHHWTWKAVDLTLIDSNWNEVEMPTGFDDFSWKATWNSVNKLPKDDPKRKNAYILRDAMEKAWFHTISSEWWHYQIDMPKTEAPRW